jgi:hypothetical protein
MRLKKMKKSLMVMFLIFLVVCSNSSLAVLHDKAAPTNKIAWIYDVDFYTLSDELSYLKSLEPSRYSYDSYNQFNIDDLWVKLNDYKALLIDEDVMYDHDWTRLDGPIYNSFKAHQSQLEQWIYSGGGLFSTDNNDLGASGGYAINELKWDWLPPPLQVVSSDVGTDASGGHLHIVDQKFWLFSRPNYLDDSYINDPSRGHAHGYFVLDQCPGYSTLMVRTDILYYGQPVEIYTTYGSGVVVLSHAELEDGSSWQYIQNELDYVLLTGREQLINALDLLNSTICDAIIKDTYLAAHMRAASLNVIDPYNTAFYVDLGKILTSLLVSAAFSWPPQTEFFDSEAVERLYLAFHYWSGIRYGIHGVYVAVDQLAKPPFDFNSIFRDKEAYDKSSLAERTAFYYNILMNKESSFPCLGWTSPDGKTFYGINGVLSLIKLEYENFRGRIPDPLPQSFNLHFVLSYLGELRRHIFVTITKQEKFWFYNATKPGGSLVELGALNPLHVAIDDALKHFKETDMISWLAWGVPLGLTIAKWALSVPSCGASLALDLGVGVTSAVVAGYAKSQKIQYRDMVAEYLLDSLEVLGTEIFLYRAILNETTKFINGLLATTGLKKPSVQVENLLVNNVDTEEEFGTGHGSIKIKNIGDVDAVVTAMVMFYAPTPQKYVWMQMIEFGTIIKGSMSEIGFDYTLPRNTLLRCTEYYAEAYAIAATADHIFSESRYLSNPTFWVGKNCGCISQTVLSGSLVQGQSYSTSFVSTGEFTRFTLFYGGSEIDLHIYDSLGRHVGLNYATAQVDVQIPGAFYSGPSETPEWILVPNSTGQQYMIKVVGIELAEEECFSVTATEIPPIPASLTTVPIKLYDTCEVGKNVSLPLTLIEYGGQHGFPVLCLQSSALTSVSGYQIPSGLVRFSDNSFSLAAGEARNIIIDVSVPSNITAGKYMGNISINMDTANLIVPIIIDVWEHDEIPPVSSLVISYPKFVASNGNIYISNASLFTMVAEDNPGGVGVASTFYRIYNASFDTGWVKYSASFRLTNLIEGLYNLAYYSVDGFGNVEPENQVTIYLDNSAPLLLVKLISTRVYAGGSATFNLTVYDDGSGVSGVEFYVDGELVANWTDAGVYTFNSEPLREGKHSFYAVAFDNLGNNVTTDVYEFEVYPRLSSRLIAIFVIAAVVVLLVITLLFVAKKGGVKRFERGYVAKPTYPATAIRACPVCGGILRYDSQQNKWYCDRCKRYY